VPEIILTATPALSQAPVARGETTLAPLPEGRVLTLVVTRGTGGALAQLNLALPATGESRSAGEATVMRPVADRAYLLDAGPDAAAALLAAGQRLVDQSDYWVALSLTGPRAAEALARHWKPDLDPAVFPPGHATRSTLGPIACILLRDGPEAFRLFLPRSFARAGFAELAETLHRLPDD
jgi:sarcosine oxidase subunit gamma